MVELLLSHDANIHDKDEGEQTTLHHIEFLLSRDAIINEKKQGKTALHEAVDNNSKATAEFLTSHGANINKKDNYIRTAIHCACYQ